ncbi:transglutaminase domain-containing protein [Flavobacterium sp. GT3R68]|uniref:transglutaminase domain-containing protein n=1 Tax=Flavobacterium sp. GT3R68 TaxID=2594437 RepID=UPI000F870EF3|nr:transglutaminase domain-containing protein [Flavobacterium sp. GT3R68]RTY94003.1 transglutaminase domain-containing protein [Flavobacterium sp. GSN2]TRW93385.1 transglutaminase domain-containing protein [Flavobacterium sp. GT3R68]
MKLKRHPLLYSIRFRLVSKAVPSDRVESFYYNRLNQKSDIPAIYYELNHLIFNNETTELIDIQKAEKIAVWLRNNIKGGPGLGHSSGKTIRKMVRGEGGVCSDFSQVFNNFCVINDLKVKEWGLKILTDDINIRGGHSFNEFYSKELKKWIFMDVSKSICFYQSDSDMPLSVLEIFNLKKENKKIYFAQFNTEYAIDTRNINDLYLDSESYPFLITNYCNKTYDFFLDRLGFLPQALIHGILILSGKSYVFEFPTQTV